MVMMNKKKISYMPLHTYGMLLLAMMLILGCSRTNQRQTVETSPQLSIVDSLLGEEYLVDLCQKSFRPPLKFEPAADSILDLIRHNMSLDLEVEGSLVLNNCFLDEANHAGLLVTVVQGLNLKSDTNSFMAEYRQSFHELFGWANVNEKDLWVGDVFIKSFTIAGDQNIHLKLLCMSQSGNSMELNYFCPTELYPQLSSRFESSAASIRLMTPTF